MDGGAATDGRAIVDEASSVLRALAHPARLMIAFHLLQGEKSVGEIEDELDLRQPALSQQLRQLREAGMVATRREAKLVYYRLDDERVPGLLETLRALFGEGRDSIAGASSIASVAKPATLSTSIAATECAVFSVASRRS